jgi:uncharacterized protein with FMN-binding domain
MKKSIVAILAVAVIGFFGIVKNHHDGAVLAPPSTSAGSSNSTASPAVATSSGTSPASAGTYKDGTYTGQSEDTEYGTVQVSVDISGGKITGVNFLQMPNDRGHSQEVTAYAEPYLKQETLQKQSSHIDFVSGASTTSEAYVMSLQAALDQAA